MSRALVRAFASGDELECIKLIANSSRESLDFRDTFQRTPMHLAAENGWDEVIQILFDRGLGDLISTDDEKRRRPMHYAAENGHLTTVRLLLQKGSSITKDSDEFTPFLSAIPDGHVDVMKFLLKNDAINSDTTPQSPLFVAAYYGHF